MTYHNSMGGILDTITGVIGSATTAALTAVAPKFSTVGGVCKPNDLATLNLFKEVQRQCNRIASKKSFVPKVGVDGEIGAGTLASIVQIQAAAKADLKALQDLARNPDPRPATAIALIRSSTCTGVASDAIRVASSLKGYADQLQSLPSAPSPAPSKQPEIYNPVTQTSSPQPTSASLLDAVRNLSTTQQLAAGAALGAVAYFALAHKKKRK